MKTLRNVVTLFILIAFSMGTNSCLVITKKSSSGKHGWYQNSNNPHHPFTTNPGKAKGKSKGKH